MVANDEAAMICLGKRRGSAQRLTHGVAGLFASTPPQIQRTMHQRGIRCHPSCDRNRNGLPTITT
jgi:hypothetical protein